MDEFLKELAELLEKYNAEITLEGGRFEPQMDINVGDSYKEFGWTISAETIRERL